MLNAGINATHVGFILWGEKGVTDIRHEMQWRAFQHWLSAMEKWQHALLRRAAFRIGGVETVNAVCNG